MKKILIVVAHPALEKSRNNIRLIKAAEALEHVVVRDLYELYPRFSINTQKEQMHLEQSDIIVLLHPFYWYSAPALLKQYLDMVFTHSWAYGKDGNKLKDKIMFNALTTSGQRESYASEEHNRFPLSSYLIPFNQMAFVCKMHYLPPYVLHESGKIPAKDSSKHAKDFKHLLSLLREPELPFDHIKDMEYINDYLAKTISSQPAKL